MKIVIHWSGKLSKADAQHFRAVVHLGAATWICTWRILVYAKNVMHIFYILSKLLCAMIFFPIKTKQKKMVRF